MAATLPFGSSPHRRYGGSSTTALGTINCVSLDVEILTRRGWLAYKQLCEGDETIGYHSATGRNEWTPVTAVHVYDDAPLVRLTNKTWKAVCTPIHRWVARKHVQTRRDNRDGGPQTSSVVVEEFVEAQAIGTRHALRLAAAADLGSGPEIGEQEAELLGWVMGDGSVAYIKSKKNSSPDHWRTGRGSLVSIRLYQSKPEHVKAIDALVDGVPFSRMVRQMNKPSGLPGLPLVTWEFRRTYSAELLKRSGYDHKNPVPFVLSLSASQRAAFIRGFFGAEGWIAGGSTLKGRTGYPKTRTYYQNDGASQDAIILAIYLSGMRPGISERDQRGAPIGRWTASKLGARISETKPFLGGERIRREEAGRGSFFCVTTGLGSWTMRQGRQVMLTGNSYQLVPDGRSRHWRPAASRRLVLGSVNGAGRTRP